MGGRGRSKKAPGNKSYSEKIHAGKQGKVENKKNSTRGSRKLKP
jgi:hypothetical protein